MLITKEVNVKYNSQMVDYYESLGYEFPKYFNKDKKKFVNKKGSMIKVKIEDLYKGSHYMVECRCDLCGKITKNSYRDYNEHNYNGLTYCNKCKGKIFLSGEKNYKWKKDLTIEDRENLRYKNAKYDEFINTVLKRDSYKCRICGSKDSIVVHHLDGYNWCKEKRTDVKNGITLCKICHMGFHSMFGNGNNTVEQFQKYCKINLDFLNNEIPITSSRKIICLDTLEIFYSAKDVGIKFNEKEYSGVYKSVNNVGNTSYRGKYFMWYDEYLSKTKEELNVIYEKCKKHTKTLKLNKTNIVCILDLKTNKMYKSMTDVGNEINKSIQFISYKINNKQEWNGHFWVRLRDYNGDISCFEKVGDDW